MDPSDLVKKLCLKPPQPLGTQQLQLESDFKDAGESVFRALGIILTHLIKHICNTTILTSIKPKQMDLINAYMLSLGWQVHVNIPQDQLPNSAFTQFNLYLQNVNINFSPIYI